MDQESRMNGPTIFALCCGLALVLLGIIGGPRLQHSEINGRDLITFGLCTIVGAVAYWRGYNNGQYCAFASINITRRANGMIYCGRKDCGMSCGGDEAHHCLTLVWDAGKFWQRWVAWKCANWRGMQERDEMKRAAVTARRLSCHGGCSELDDALHLQLQPRRAASPSYSPPRMQCVGPKNFWALASRADPDRLTVLRTCGGRGRLVSSLSLAVVASRLRVRLDRHVTRFRPWINTDQVFGTHRSGIIARSFFARHPPVGAPRKGVPYSC